VPNKLNADLRALILGALEDAGGRDYLTQQAMQNPGAFLTLVGKVLPSQMVGDEQQPVVVSFEWAPTQQAAPEPTFAEGTEGFEVQRVAAE